MQNEKCKSCFECTETVIVKVRDDRNSEWRDSSVRRCANDQCWHIVDGTRADRLTWISNVYDYKYFGDYELSHEQIAAVYEAKSLAALSAAEPQPAPSVAVKALEWTTPHPSTTYPEWRTMGLGFEAVIDKSQPLFYGDFPLRINGRHTNEKFDTLEAAKAFAQADYDTRIRFALSAQVQDVAEGWHVASNSGSVLIYCLKQDGWRKGEPVMVNDIMIRVENANRSSNELQPIVDAIMRALPAAPVKQEGGE